MEPGLLRRAAAAEDGRLPNVQLDSTQRLVAVEDVERFLAKRAQNPTSRNAYKAWATRHERRETAPPASPEE